MTPAARWTSTTPAATRAYVRPVISVPTTRTSTLMVISPARPAEEHRTDEVVADARSAASPSNLTLPFSMKIAHWPSVQCDVDGLLDDDHRDPFFLQLVDHAEPLLDDDRRQAQRQFVDDEQLRLEQSMPAPSVSICCCPPDMTPAG